MFVEPTLLTSIIQAALLLGNVEARVWLLGRDRQAVYARGFGREQSAVSREIAADCTGGICDTLAGEAVTSLLATQPGCSQQDMADKIVDTSHQFDPTAQDFTTKPPRLWNSVFFRKAPKDSQFNGLVQAQDPANDPNLFFEPAKGATVTRRSQPNTFGAVSSDDEGGGANYNVGNNSTESIGNFGSCPVPEIEYGQGYDGRLESSFRPVDQESYSHGSSTDIDIIAQFMCDQLGGLCNADATALTTCADARASASSDTPQTGLQADIFNAGFDIITNFAQVPVFDDQGHLVPGNGIDGDGDESPNGGDNTNNSG